MEVNDREEPHEIEETEKGCRYMSGYERVKLRLDTRFSETRALLERMREKCTERDIWKRRETLSEERW